MTDTDRILEALTEHRIETARAFSALEAQMVEVLGHNGNPGRLGKLEKRVNDHETKINRASGAFGILLLIGGGMHWAIDAIRSAFHK